MNHQRFEGSVAIVTGGWEQCSLSTGATGDISGGRAVY